MPTPADLDVDRDADEVIPVQRACEHWTAIPARDAAPTTPGVRAAASARRCRPRTGEPDEQQRTAHTK